MKQFILILVFIAVAVFAFTQFYDVEYGRSKDGSFSVVIVNTASGAVTRLLGR